MKTPITTFLMASVLFISPAAVLAQGAGGGAESPGAGSTKEQQSGPSAKGGADTSSQNQTQKDAKDKMEKK